MTNPKTLPVGSTIGILGGGQLGRMLAVAASRLGMKSHIYCPDTTSPAFDVSPYHTIAGYDDSAALDEFAASVDVVTYEFENVPAVTAHQISKKVRLAPGEEPLKISQDRLLEKKFLEEQNIAISPYLAIKSLDDLFNALENIGTPAVLKTTRFGYDGKGQRIIHTTNDAQQAFCDLAGQNLVLEKFIPFEMEISVIIARNAAGQINAFEPSCNVHKNHILHTSTIPANITTQTRNNAVSIAKKIAHTLEYQGVLAVEFFVLDQKISNNLVINEIAPRVHNSGHWTQGVCPVDQFEQHIRAICNWPLGNTQRLANVVMTNLIGNEIHQIPDILRPGDIPHIYAKHESRPGRKMGHINSITPLKNPQNNH